jgi:high-affinity iron transporter
MISGWPGAPRPRGSAAPQEQGVITGFLIGLREGVEAALIVGIIVAYLVRTGNRDRLPLVWLGTAAAIAASVLLGALLFVTVGSLDEPYEQLFEGAAMLLAAGVVTWMLFWMRSQARTVRGALEADIARSLGTGGALGLAVLAFVAVVREGIESALFLFGQVAAAGTASNDDPVAVLAGAAVGLLVAAAIGYLVYRGSTRLDLRTFFTWTGVALIFVAAGLVSRSVHEFAEIGVIAIGTQTAFDVSGVLPHASGVGQFLRAAFGYSSQPEVVTVVAYLAYLLPVLYLYLRPARPASAEAS